MRWLSCLAFGVVFLLFSSCGGSDPGGVAALTDRAQKCLDEFLASNDDEAYDDCHAEDFKDKCSRSDFVAIRGAAADAYEQYYDVEFDDIEFRITNVRIEDGRGYVTTEAFLDGESLNPEVNEDPGEYWLYEDGDWRATDEDENPCETPAVPTD